LKKKTINREPPLRKGKRCCVCAHPERDKIEIALLCGRPMRSIEEKYGVALWSVWNHRARHLPAQQKAAIVAGVKAEIDVRALERQESEGLLGAIIAQRARLQALLEMAVDKTDVRGAMAVERGVTANLELTARLLGEITTHHQVTSTSVLLTPDYMKLRRTIVDALRDHPAAGLAVSAALHRLEVESAEAIAADARKGLAPVLDLKAIEAAGPC
jgi:hypothetical protein